MDEISEREPLPLFERWYGEALAAESDANAMVLATVGADGRPSARAVLLKGCDDRGLVFYTNLESRKARELAGNPHAALCFFWRSSRRQVRFEGAVEAVTAAEADAYFATRPRDSRIGAFTRRFGDGEIPRPPFWSGYRVVPHRVEFWQERPFRLHDRWLYVRVNGAWQCERLFP